jgi:DNA-binding LacI/PurR family transcriptional regulator
VATIKDIAREANVSVGTVSKVLNGNKNIKPQNYQRVIDAIDKLNYRPNLVARTLKTKISKSIGLIIPDITNPYYPELARGVEDSAKKAGFTVFLCNADRNVSKENEYLDALINKNVDGIILVKPQMETNKLCELKKYCELTIADANEELQGHFDVVNVNDTLGAKKAMDLLFEYGHKRIAFISGLMESESARLRYNSYKKALKERGIELDDQLVKQGNYDWYSGYISTIELLRLTSRPTAIFTSNDIMAFGAIKALRERNIKIPSEMSIIGYDDIDMASYCAPQLTTVRQPKYEIGTSSVEILIKRIQNPHQKDESYMNITLNPEVMFRETVTYPK